MIKVNNLHLILTSSSSSSSSCSGSGFFSFPTWYEYLNLNTNCTPSLNSIGDVWLIVLAIINILLHLAALIAVFLIIYGGIKYITSQGSPDTLNKAQKTVLSAVIGLVITIVADVTVSFVAGSIK